jgi:glycosyltransferase involved in cell wall biosynthesis
LILKTTPLRIELVEHTVGRNSTGIGRYTLAVHEALQCFNDRFSVHLTKDLPPPLAERFTPLAQFPRGIAGHHTSSIVHFLQIAGCSQMLWHPVHPAAATVHDLGVLICKEDEILFNRLERWILACQIAGLRRMDGFVAVSQFTADSLANVLGIHPDRIHVVYHGVDHQRFRPDQSAQHKLAARYPDFLLHNNAKLLLYVGSELPRKNLPVLLEALAIAKAEGHCWQLVKAGDSGGERWRNTFLETARRLGLVIGVDVLLPGRVSDEDLALFYNAVDIFVTPSLLEGFGLPVLEAMACGTPVVCANSGALPEVTGNAAVLVDARNAVALKNALAVVLNDSTYRQRIRAAGFERAAAFTWKNSATQLAAFYERLSTQLPTE